MKPRHFSYGDRQEKPQGRAHGRVVSFSSDKRYGFIRPSHGGDDVFVHVTAVEGGVILSAGDIVEFDVMNRGSHAKGSDRPMLRAIRVVRIGGA